MNKRFEAETLIKWLLIITITAIWGQSMIPRSMSQAESDAILTVFNPFDDVEIGDVTSEVYWQMSDVLRKLAHLMEYAILGGEMILYYTVKMRQAVSKGAFRNMLFAGLLVGLIDETIQVFSHRGSLVTDIWIDTIGAAIGLVICRAIYHKRIIKISQKKSHKFKSDGLHLD